MEMERYGIVRKNSMYFKALKYLEVFVNQRKRMMDLSVLHGCVHTGSFYLPPHLPGEKSEPGTELLLLSPDPSSPTQDAQS